MHPLALGLLIAFLGLLIIFGIGYAVLRWAYKKAFYCSERVKNYEAKTAVLDVKDERSQGPMLRLLEELEACPFERVEITSRDGLRLSGRYYRFCEDETRMEILFHGWKSNALRDACGGAKLARDGKYNLLIPDQRGHGQSEGNTLTFGIKERYDCLDWVHYAIDRFGKDVKILLGGVSMGAATVLMAAALPLPKNVLAITADCGYSSPEAIIRKVCRDMGISDRVGYPTVYLSARLLGGFSLSDGGAVEAVKQAKVPIMLMHGEEDDFVPFAMCGEIYAAIAGEKRLLTIPQAGHGLAYFYDTERYCREVGNFKKQAFEGKLFST